MRHDGDNHASWSEASHHVLDEHEVGLLAGLWTPAVSESLGKWDSVPAVVLAKRRVGNDAVETHQLAALKMERLFGLIWAAGLLAGVGVLSIIGLAGFVLVVLVGLVSEASNWIQAQRPGDEN